MFFDFIGIREEASRVLNGCGYRNAVAYNARLCAEIIMDKVVVVYSKATKND